MHIVWRTEGAIEPVVRYGKTIGNLDREVRGEAWFGYEMKNVSLTLDGRVNHRSGDLANVTDSATDKTVMATVGYRL